jgi:hypothetical protein
VEAKWRRASQPPSTPSFWKRDPIPGRPRAAVEEVGDFLNGMASVQPKQSGQILVNPRISLLAPPFFDVLA